MPPSSAILHRIATSTLPHTTTSSPSLPRQKHQQISPPAAVSEAVDIPDTVARYHSHPVSPSQCSSVIVMEIRAPIDAVWSVLRRFENPQSYKHFVKTCDLLHSKHVSVGSLRRVHLISGLPAATSTERLEILDDDRHVISFSVVGGDHRLSNYRSVTSLHQVDEGITMVVESYVVNTPAGNTKEETCLFIDTIVRCNLQSLAQIAESSARRDNIGEKSQSIS